jgi:hypothetical protein
VFGDVGEFRIAGSLWHCFEGEKVLLESGVAAASWTFNAHARKGERIRSTSGQKTELDVRVWIRHHVCICQDDEVDGMSCSNGAAAAALENVRFHLIDD